MIRHLFRLVWNMKRTNVLIVLEIFISFLVVFAVTTSAIHFIGLYEQPVGYDIRDVWNISVDVKQSGNDKWGATMVENFEKVLREVDQMNGVVASGGILNTPYGFGETTWTSEINGRTVRTSRNEVTDGVRDVLGLEIVEGRWFEASDDALAWKPVVIDRDTAEAAFGDQSPIGKLISEPDDSRELRVVGVVSEFRKGGELEAKNNYVIERQRVGHPDDRPPRNILIKVRPGTPASFEAEIIRLLERVVPEWSFDVRPLSRSRDTALRLKATPLIIGGVVASFLILMVILGLTGVMWQNVTRRRPEIGLRRAMGASGRAIYLQVLFEIAIITTFGVVLGVALAVQIPVLGWFGFIEPPVFTAGMIAALLTMYGLTMACGLYPSWMAARVQPAVALHYE